MIKKKNGNTTRPWKGKVISYRLVEFFPNQTLCFFTSFFSFLFKVIKQELARWSLGISQFFFYVFSFLKKRQTEPTGLPTCVATIILSMTSCMTSISRQVSVDPTNRSLHVAASIPSKCSPKTIPPKTIYYQQYS